MRDLKHIPRNSSNLEDVDFGDDDLSDKYSFERTRMRQVYSSVTSFLRSLMSFDTRRQRSNNRQEVLLLSKLEQLSAVERITDVDPRTPSHISNNASPWPSITQTPSTRGHFLDRRRPVLIHLKALPEDPQPPVQVSEYNAGMD
jgi:hypothetical protein